MTGFTGFPESAFDFYDDLEIENTRSFWQAHKQVYDESVRAPMLALTTALAAEFGDAKVYRPYRDVRFAKDKTPYKTHQGAYVSAATSVGWYCEIAAPGFRVGAGWYRPGSADLDRLRTAIDTDRQGRELERIVKRLERAGFELQGDAVKTAPRGFTRDHPRIRLLRHKTLFAGLSYGFDEVIDSPDLVDRVRADWRRLRPLVHWAARQVEPLSRQG